MANNTITYTNSPLADVTILSPNHSGTRTHVIDRITPHCVVGQATAEAIAGVFKPTARQASCNYGIGKDGKIALICEEKNRSWCSSSWENDQRAITIEVASDTTHPYAFRDAAYNALIDLCTDICRRNGKKKLLWFADKAKTLSYQPADDEMVLTVHRWFANKACPGDWMYSRMGELADKVTARLNGSTMTTPPNTPTITKPTQPSTTPPTTINTEKTIWDTLYAAIGNAFGVAGLMGNLYAESALNPQNLQNNGNSKLGMTDAEFTKAVDSGKYAADIFIHDGYGYGLAQWTYYSRKQALLNYAKTAGKSIGDLSMQLGFLLQEIKGYKQVWNTLVNATTVREASDVVLLKFERPADQSEKVCACRAAYGQKYFDKYKDETTAPTTPTPYLVRITDELVSIRKGPGANYGSYGYIHPGVYTVVDEENGWGLLKGYAKYRNGWIPLNCVNKV